MKRLAALLLLASAVAAAAAPSVSFAVDPTISASCRPGAPASYSRPAAYCDIIASNDSLFTPSNNPPPEPEAPPPADE